MAERKKRSSKRPVTRLLEYRGRLVGYGVFGNYVVDRSGRLVYQRHT